MNRNFELFFFKADSEWISFNFPASKRRIRSSYKIETRCPAPPPFDMCLTMENSPEGPKKYYSMKHQQEMANYFPQLDIGPLNAEKLRKFK